MNDVYLYIGYVNPEDAKLRYAGQPDIIPLKEVSDSLHGDDSYTKTVQGHQIQVPNVDVWKGKWDEPIQELYQALRDLQVKLVTEKDVTLKTPSGGEIVLKVRKKG